MFRLSSSINIGKFKRIKPSSVKVKTTTLSYLNTADVVLPNVVARLNRKTSNAIENIDVDKAFNVGDPVEIKLGYNGKLKTEFIGFISQIQRSNTVLLKCEGYSYLVRVKREAKVFKNTTLKDILKYLVSGTKIRLGKDIPDIKVAKMIWNNTEGTRFIDEISKQLLVTIFFDGDTLYAQLRFLARFGDVKYRYGWNTIDENNLESKDSKKIRIQVIAREPNGNIIKESFGDVGGDETLINLREAVVDRQSIKDMAKQAYLRKVAEKIGGIKTFLEPYAKPGMRAIYENKKWPDRSGTYFIDSVEVQFGTGGARRIVGFGLKLS